MSNPTVSKRRIVAVASCMIVVVAAFSIERHSIAPSASHGIATPSIRPNNPNPDSARVQSKFAALPVAFERNEGQADPQVKYMARGRGYKLYLTSSQAILTIHRQGENSPVRAAIERKRLGPARAQKMLQERRKAMMKPSHVAVVRMQLLGSDPSAEIATADPQAGKVNYFIGRDSSKWHPNVPLFGRVSYRNLYPGIDLAFHGASQQLEFDYLVSPGADAHAIGLGFLGAEKINVTAAGDLVLTTAAGPIEMRRPVAYQEYNGAKQIVEARFVLKNANEVAFSLGTYDQSRELVIDPVVTYSTYFGGDFADYGLSVVADANGDAFVAGATDSDTIPGNSSGTDNFSFDVFVTEINSAGALQFTTIFGGSGDDFPGFPGAIAIDSTGIYVAGTTSSDDFPVTSGAAQTTFQGGSATNGDNDAFATKLSLDGSSLTWATYVGGNDSDSGLGLAVDANKNVYVVGETFSTNLPVKNALPSGTALNLGKGTGDDDGYIAVLNSTASAFTLVSYIGGSNADIATGVALDGAGNAYVSGATVSSDLPVTSGVVQSTLKTSGIDDIFVCSIKASSFAEANLVGAPVTVARESSRSKSFSSRFALWLPIPALAIFGSFWCTADARRRKLLHVSLLCLALFALLLMPACGGSSSSGGGGVGGGGGGGGGSTGSYVYMTYYGGSSYDEGIAIAADSTGNAFVTGHTQSMDFPHSTPAYQSALAPGATQNSFLLELNPTGTQALYSTYLGGNGTDYGLGIAIDASDNAYLTGQTDSTNFPVVGNTQAGFGGATDAYVSVLSPSSNSLLFSTYLGGSGDEDQLGGSIYVNTAGAIYVTGDTTSGSTGTTSFPLVNPLDPAYGGGTCLDANNNSVPCTDAFMTSYTAIP